VVVTDAANIRPSSHEQRTEVHMSSHSIPHRPLRYRATAGQTLTNSAFDPEGDDDSREDMPPSNGWFDSSFELRQGLEVIEWVLPDVGPGKPTPS
jgi:hypothetical protein